jgi:RNA polymerase sigma-70 factor (ECF subfamily)
MGIKQASPSLHGLDDEQLARRARGSDAAARLALSLYLERRRGALLRLCQARLGNRQDSEDAVQETLLRAYRGFAGYREEASLNTWLHSIAENQCHSLAARRVRRLLSEHLQQLIELHEQQRQRPAAPGRAETRQRVHRLLDRLPAGDRDVLLLRFFQELALEDISATLGISLSATKMRLYRALERAGQALAKPSSAGV